MGRGLSEQQNNVLQILHKQESAPRWHFAEIDVETNDAAKTASASISRTLKRLVQRGLIERFYFRFGPQKRGQGLGNLTKRGEFRWRLTEKGKKAIG
jgi:DNA-binding HxlR family transcriptional regulator